MNSFERFSEEKLPARKYFYSSTKKGKIDNDGKISDGHISIENYLMGKQIWNKFKMKNMGDYHERYLKTDALRLTDVFEKFIKKSDIGKYLFIENRSRRRNFLHC